MCGFFDGGNGQRRSHLLEAQRKNARETRQQEICGIWINQEKPYRT